MQDTASDRDTLNASRRELELLTEPQERLKRKLDDHLSQQSRLQDEGKALNEKNIQVVFFSVPLGHSGPHH